MYRCSVEEQICDTQAKQKNAAHFKTLVHFVFSTLTQLDIIFNKSSLYQGRNNPLYIYGRANENLLWASAMAPIKLKYWKI